jgi:predicted transcriptional regulator
MGVTTKMKRNVISIQVRITIHEATEILVNKHIGLLHAVGVSKNFHFLETRIFFALYY